MGLGTPGGEELLLEEAAEPVGLDPGVDEADVCDEGVDEGHADDRGRGDLQPGDHARDVHEEQPQEDRGEQRLVRLGPLPQDLLADLALGELEHGLDHPLGAPGHQAGPLRVQGEDHDERQGWRRGGRRRSG